MKYLFRFTLRLLLCTVGALPLARAQHITLQPASGGVTTIFTSSANDTAISITNGRTIRFKPGVNGIVVGNSAATQYVLPAARGTTGQTLALDASGNLIWSTPAVADHLGNHTATQKLDLATFKLVGNGGTLGLSITAAGAATLDHNLLVTGDLTTGAISSGNIISSGSLQTSGSASIGGDVATNTLNASNANVFGAMKVGSVGNDYTLPATRGTNLQVLTTNGAGGTSWATVGGADNLGNHNATQRLNLATFKLVGNGGTSGLSISVAGAATLDNNLSVAGTSSFTGAATFNGAATLSGGTTFNSGVNSYTMPTTRGTTGQYLSISGSAVGWATPLTGATGASNTTLGIGTGIAITTATNNAFFGAGAGQGVTVGNDNTFLGKSAGGNVTASSGNIAIGNAALLSQAFNNGGSSWNGGNIAIGNSAMLSLNSTATSNGIYNIAIGESAMLNNTTGNQNIAIGAAAGGGGATGSGNIYLGYQSGWGTTTSNKLYIENSSNVISPLIGGDFSANTVSIGGTLSVNASPNTYSLPTTLGTNGQVLTTNGAGTTSWTTVGGADNLGNHTATQALNLGAFKLVGNGGSSGLSITVGGAASFDNTLSVLGASTFTGGVTVSGASSFGGGATFNTATNAFTMPTTRASAAGQVLTATNTTGGLAWGTPTGDNLGNHTATQALNLATFKLVGNGGTAGLSISNTGAATFDNTINAGTIVLGGAINANAGNFNSGVSSSDYIYMSATTPRIKTVSHLQFYGLASGARGNVGSSTVAEYAYFAASPVVANLELPDGAIVNGIDVYMSQTAGTSTVKLVKMTSTGTTVMGTASIIGAVTASTPTSATFTSFTINNNTDTYALQYDGAANGINYKLYRVVVNYTVAKPD